MSDSIIRGKLKSKSDSVYDYFKMYRKGIRQLYKACKPSCHKRLGYIFQMLPYINRQFNIVSKNPLETDYNKVIPISFHDFCITLGYDITHEHRLLNEYRKTTFVVDGKVQTFIYLALPIEGKYLNDGMMIINPQILYGGNSASKIDVYRIFQNLQRHF